MKLQTFCLAILIVAYASARGDADGVLISSYGGGLEEVTEERFEASKKRTVEEILELNRNLKSWPEAYEVLVGASVHFKDPDLVQGLLKQLSDTKVTKLTTTSRLVVWPRIASGDIFFEGKGLQVDDDLFSVAGRANWILRTLAKKNFGIVPIKPTKQELETIQQRWTRHFQGEEVAEVAEPYPNNDKGIDDIQSIEALEALIVSLKASKQKSDYTARKLKTLYQLDKMPDDPESPAHFCNPDTYTNMYLQMLTGIEEKHPYEWWLKWWKENKDQLQWDPENAQFTTAPKSKDPSDKGDEKTPDQSRKDNP